MKWRFGSTSALLLLAVACGSESGPLPSADDTLGSAGGSIPNEPSGGGPVGSGGFTGPTSGGANGALGGGSTEPEVGGAGAGGDTGGGAATGGGSPSSGGSLASGGTSASGGADASGGAQTGSGGSSDCAPFTPPSGPIGYGRMTTGGGDQAPTVVSSFEEAKAALASYRTAFKEGEASSLVLHYDGQFDFSSITDVCAQHTKEAQILEIKEMENVTFRGVSGSTANFGIKINRAKNVIVQNMIFGLLPGGGSSDAITVEGNDTNGDVEHVWIDHNEFFSSTKDDCPDAGDTEFDGLIDVKKGARLITVSFNYFHDHQKTGLLGSSDTDATERYVTFHHNHYENLSSRTPLQRFGYTHIFNNYYHHITSSGINVRMGGLALIEANHFEDVKNPVTSRYSEEVGFWDLRDNLVAADVTFDVEEDTLANADDWKSTKAFPDDELTYEYTAIPAACVKNVVTEEAGATL
jgi:pectate lyase